MKYIYIIYWRQW